MTFCTEPAKADFIGARDIVSPITIAWFASFVALWTLYFTIANAPTPINHDLSEAYAWGRQFELGYYQHPPFWAWICGVWFRIFPRTLWAFSLLSSLNAGLGLWGAGKLIGDFAQGAKRSAAWMLLLLTPCYTFLSYKYNANLIFLPIWPWAMHYAADTLLGALAMNLPAFLVVAVIARSPFREWSAQIAQISKDPSSRLRALATLTIAPLALTLISGILLRTKTTAEMTVSTFSLAPLLMIEIAGAKNIDRLRRVASRLAAAVSIVALALAPAIALTKTYLAHTSQDVRPSQELAIEATKIWRARTGLPLVYVAGSDRYANDVAFYSPERPHAFELFQYSRNLWVTPEELAQDGLLSVCIKNDDDCLAATATFSTPQSTQVSVALSHVFWGHSSKTSEFVVTIIPPRSDSPPRGDYAQAR
jgi:hypothetical protein